MNNFDPEDVKRVRAAIKELTEQSDDNSCTVGEVANATGISPSKTHAIMKDYGYIKGDK